MGLSYYISPQSFFMEIPAFSLLFIIVLASLGVLVLHYLLVFLPISWYKTKKLGGVTNAQHSISVVIAARNERYKLEKNLPEILQQKNQDYDVVVVNDQSWDSSESFLTDFEKENEGIHVVNIQENERHRSGKKLALTLGVKAAKSDHLLLTDADCVPATKNWVFKVAQHFQAGYDMIIGYSPIQPKAGLGNFLQRCDNFLTAIQYLGWGSLGMHYMGVGRNLAYDRKKFFEVGGFKKDYHLMAGDDDLFVNRNGKHFKKRLLLDPDTFVYTEGQKSFGDWFRQKKRHFSVSKYYKFGHKFMISLFPLFQWVFLGSIILWGIQNPDMWQQLLVIVGIKYFFTTLVGLIVGSKLKNMGAGFLLFFVEYFFMLFYPIVYLAQKLKPTKYWR